MIQQQPRDGQLLGLARRHAIVARFRHGSGWITGLSDAVFLGNDRIGDHDHAASPGSS